MIFEWTVARSHILGDPRRALFSVLSVALAVAVIVVLIGITEGYRQNLVQNTVENNPHITVYPEEDEDYIRLYRTLSETIRQYPGVEAVSPRLIGRATARYEDEPEGAVFVGVDPVQEDRLMRVQDDMVWGDFYDLQHMERYAVAGQWLAEDLELKRDDEFSISRQNISIDVRLAGVIRTGTDLDDTLIYLPLETAQDLVAEGDVVSEIGVRLADFNAAIAVSADLNDRTGYTARSWQEENRDALSQLQSEQAYSVIFYALIFIISGFGIANTMIMIIARRTREIGIFMAMGATRRSIMKIFLIESTILAPPAVLLGGLLAYLAATVMGTIEIPTAGYVGVDTTVVLRLEAFALVSLFALLVNFIAGIYPAYRAAHLDPVEAIATG